MTKGPRRFNPEEFSQRARDLHAKWGLDPSYGSMVIGGRKVPSIAHDVAEDSVGPTIGFRIPTEFGTPTLVDIERTMSKDDPLISVYSPIESRFHITAGGNKLTPYEGPEHLNELLDKHHHDLRSGLLSGQFKVGPDDRGWQDSLVDNHRRVDPEYHVRAWYNGGQSGSVSGWLSPRQGFKFRNGD